MTNIPQLFGPAGFEADNPTSTINIQSSEFMWDGGHGYLVFAPGLSISGLSLELTSVTIGDYVPLISGAGTTYYPSASSTGQFRFIAPKGLLFVTVSIAPGIGVGSNSPILGYIVSAERS